MKSSDIPAKFPIPFANSAGGGFIRTIPQASQIGITPGAASLTDGFVPINFLPVGAGGIPPFGQDFNGLLKQITQWSRWQGAGGSPVYDLSFSTSIGGYPTGCVVSSTTAGLLWLCIVDDNTSNPDTGGAGWVPISTLNTGSTIVTLNTGAGNFTVPANVYALQVQAAGAGGGGGYAAASGANAGGNGGFTVTGRLTVTPGQIIAWSVGAVGIGGTSGTPATAGGDAAFGAYLAKGGGAAANVGAVAGSAPNNLSGSTGPQIFSGQQAEAGFVITTAPAQQWGGHGGQSFAGGFGGNGARNGGTGGNAGSIPGGGGGGGSSASTGGNGGAGWIILQY